MKKYKHLSETSKNDRDKINEILNANLFNGFYKFLFGCQSVAEVSQSNGYWEKVLNILNDSGEKIGFIELKRINIFRVRFSACVFEEFSGKGYGSKAIKAILGLCKDLGYESIEGVTAGVRQLKLYEKLGFKKVGHLKKRVVLTDGKLYDDFLIERFL